MSEEERVKLLAEFYQVVHWYYKSEREGWDSEELRHNIREYAQNLKIPTFHNEKLRSLEDIIADVAKIGQVNDG